MVLAHFADRSERRTGCVLEMYAVVRRVDGDRSAQT